MIAVDSHRDDSKSQISNSLLAMQYWKGQGVWIAEPISKAIT